MNDALKQSGTRVLNDGRLSRMRGAFVVAEIALSMILLACSGLLIESFVALSNVALGFQPERFLLMATGLPVSGSEADARAASSFNNCSIRFHRFLAFQLPADPTVYVCVAVLLALVVLAASYFPAWRAARLDPLVVLRQE